MLPWAGQEELLVFVLACGCGLGVHACGGVHNVWCGEVLLFCEAALLFADIAALTRHLFGAEVQAQAARRFMS